MQSLKELYKIGMGPSSSHTMGPRKAADAFNRTYPTAESFRAVLYGSLAATGKGHLTDFAIKEAFYPKPVTIEWKYDTFLPKHPNAMRFEALDKAGHIMGAQVAYSIGGGDIRTDEAFGREINHIYPHKSMAEILQYTSDKRMLLWEYVEEFEGTDIWQYLATIWKTMQTTMNRGLEKRGVLPGSLNLERKARRYLYKAENSPNTCAG